MYTVERQDNLSGIAHHFGVDIAALVLVNGLRNPDLVKVGETLMIPRLGQPFVSPADSASRLIWPIEGAISQPFGVLHQGVDIAQAQGAPIQAVAKGRVVHAERLETDYGWFIVIEHGNGLQSVYAHLSAFFVYTGQWVESGQLIGRVGTTGKSTGPHLHFELRSNGHRVNPLDSLAPRP
jgi:murein DD-endopeptidase MepM/ murein hydrolase activator NlpD